MKAQDYINSKNLSQENDRDIVGVLWYDGKLRPLDKVNITFELFDRSPEHGICGELKMAYNEMNDESRTILWRNYLHYLKSGTDEQKKQISYSLWVDFFEDPETVSASWTKMIETTSDIQIKRQILSISGPVPFDKKDRLYSELISDIQNHDFILNSLVGSFFDVYGQIDIQKVKKILQKLKIDKNLKNYKKLNEYLNRFNSQREFRDFVKNEKR